MVECYSFGGTEGFLERFLWKVRLEGFLTDCFARCVYTEEGLPTKALYSFLDVNGCIPILAIHLQCACATVLGEMHIRSE